MRIVFKIISVFLALALTLLAISFFLPAHYSVEHSTEISVNPDSCLASMRSPQTWSHWMLNRSDEGVESSNRIFKPDAQFVHSGLSGNIFEEGIIRRFSVDTIWVEASPAGSIVRWKSKLQFDFPVGRFVGLFSRRDFDKQVQMQLDSLQKYLDESTLGAPVRIDQTEAIGDQ
jgi:hypothetical protein